jgi:hypothetical protein
MVNYDEEAEMTRYVWENYSQLMTEFERRVGLAIVGRMKAASTDHPQLSKMLDKRWGSFGDPDVDAALADGPEVFRRRTAHRLLAERASDILTNRCPSCGRMVRTPKARQCFWCGFDWHERCL